MRVPLGAPLTKMLGELPPHVASPNLSLYWSDNYVALDFETTATLKGSPVCDDNRLILASWFRPGEHIRSHFGSEYDQPELLAAIEDADFIVAHNAKFELGWLRRCGLDLRRLVVFDTMIGEYVLGGNRFHPSQLGLEACLKRAKLDGKAGPVNWMIKQGFPVENIPTRWLQTYCERDVMGCHELFLLQRTKLKERGLEAVNYARNLLAPALADIEFNGMQLDEEAVLKLEQEQESEYIKATNELTELCGGIEPSQAKQLAPYVYTKLGFAVPRDYRGKPLKTATGQYSVKADVMDKLVAKTEAQRKFLDLYRHWTSSNGKLTKYLRKFGDCCREAGGMLYGVFNQCNTKTHRLSSSGAQYRVQFQNFSRAFKPLFRSRNPDWAVGEADGAQLEFRVAVHLGRDKVGLRYITDDDSDIHRFTASVLNSIPESDVDREQRQVAKNDTFKPLYGGQSGTDIQQKYYAAFKDKYKGVADTQQRWIHEVLRDKRLRTEWGLIYYWPDTKVTRTGYITNSTNISNYPVQAFATAEIIPLAIVAAWHRMEPLQSYLINTVHDSIIAELHPDEHDAWHIVAKQCLITDAYELVRAIYGIRLTVPLGAGVMIGDRWGSKMSKDSEVVYDAPQELWYDAAKEAGMI